MVYRAHLTGFEGNSTAQVVAVKTLKCMLRYSMREERVCYQLRMMALFEQQTFQQLLRFC